jgi:FtsP/CotA-like multicopper oxidase with cupredoxin domain
MMNIGGDVPFGGDLPGESNPNFAFTNLIMAFDVGAGEVQGDNFNLTALDEELGVIAAARTPLGQEDYTRQVALFEGTDEFGRLQPLLGTVMPASTWQGRIINWPNEQVYRDANLIGPMQGTMTWHEPITENPQLNSVEVWEIWNFSPDAHPIHLHLVKFKVVDRQTIKWDTNANAGHVIQGEAPAGDGVYLVPQNTIQHNDEVGKGFMVVLPPKVADYVEEIYPNVGDEYVEDHFKDIVTALPGQITRITMEFTKFGRYVWHCHILSHEDHEMMRVMFVGGNPSGASGRSLRGYAENEDET